MWEERIFPTFGIRVVLHGRKEDTYDLLYPRSVAPGFILKLLVCFVVVSRLSWRFFTWRNDDIEVLKEIVEDDTYRQFLKEYKQWNQQEPFKYSFKMSVGIMIGFSF